LLIALVIAAYVLLIAVLMRGKNIAIINPKGLIAQQQHSLMMYSVMVMLILAVPAVSLIFLTAWRYRDSNKRAHYEPNGHHSKLLVLGLWLVPASFILLLATMMVPATHRLEPRKALADGKPPMTIQVVALRWKWLFIYPDQKIATVNYVQLPLNTPVQFDLTADEAPMSSFWMPNFGGQLYAMTGHVNRLNLEADTAGDYPGKSAEINGAGFTGMQFVAHATSQQSFDQWVRSVQTSPNHLDESTYQELLKPSENNAPAFYALTDQSLYDTIVQKYNGGGHTHHE
jgi:cytochrome o ubiquinol oxidase subunit 2